ncbi:ArgE/DapE family deacylase [Desulfopila aestuarii]|uniref:Acetylornithine deacetylase n=1 Tax=Desulfopila aestuarii DSM 18488 TaxID=1121416 RepID=A0A1M7YCL9_9BACT|nr:ArgE/DapE family deacylase [Desulfopila aestuarii]SHO50353.1 acetylornithine deacetylase [Desulfopila aestuarii DSM 18488]
MTAQEKRILEIVTGLSDDIFDFTSRLVAQPSTLGNEAGAVAVMNSELQKLDFTTSLIPLESEDVLSHPGYASVPWSISGRNNVVGTMPAVANGGRSALLNGHLDVVSAGNGALWRHDPFTPTEADGWLYGRGAGDMKSGIAAMTYAAHAIRKAGFGLAAPLTIAAVIEEECSGNGAIATLAAGYDAEAVLIPEPFGPTILTDQLGVMWFKVHLAGRPTHVLQAGSGVNAIEKCYPLILALREFEEELNHDRVPLAYRNTHHPINLNIGIIEGGDWPSTVAAEATFHGRLSFFPGTDYTDIRNRLEATILRAAEKDEWLRRNLPEVDFYGFRSEGHSLPSDLPAFQVLDGCHHDITGIAAERYISTCTTDLRAYHFYGKGQATCFGPVAENIHGTDERVHLESVLHVAKTYALFLARWCHLVE